MNSAYVSTIDYVLIKVSFHIRTFSRVCIGELSLLSLEEAQLVQVSQLKSRTTDYFHIVLPSTSHLNKIKQDLMYHLHYLRKQPEQEMNKVIQVNCQASEYFIWL